MKDDLNPMLTPEEIEVLRRDLKASAAQASIALEQATKRKEVFNPLTPEEVEALRKSKKASLEYMKKALQRDPPQEK